VFVLYYHFDPGESPDLVEVMSEALGATCEIEADQDGTGETVYAPHKLAVNGMRLALWKQPLWRRP
jgi:hypothetical protein